MNIIFLDTETTGLKDGRLIQVAYKARGSDVMVCEYFKPPIPIEIEAMAVHHITEKKVSDKPVFAGSKVFTELSTLLPSSTLVAHNANYDISILKTEQVPVGKFICTYKVSYYMYDLPSYKMQYLRYLWGIDIDSASAHDAEGDVAVLEKVFDHMIEEYSQKNNVSHDETIEKFTEISGKPQLLRKIMFGKHAGKTFEEVKKLDPSYLSWLLTLTEKDEDFMYTVKHYTGNV